MSIQRPPAPQGRSDLSLGAVGVSYSSQPSVNPSLTSSSSASATLFLDKASFRPAPSNYSNGSLDQGNHSSTSTASFSPASFRPLSPRKESNFHRVTSPSLSVSGETVVPRSPRSPRNLSSLQQDRADTLAKDKREVDFSQAAYLPDDSITDDKPDAFTDDWDTRSAVSMKSTKSTVSIMSKPGSGRRKLAKRVSFPIDDSDLVAIQHIPPRQEAPESSGNLNGSNSAHELTISPVFESALPVPEPKVEQGRAINRSVEIVAKITGHNPFHKPAGYRPGERSLPRSSAARNRERHSAPPARPVATLNEIGERLRSGLRLSGTAVPRNRSARTRPLGGSVTATSDRFQQRNSAPTQRTGRLHPARTVGTRTQIVPENLSVCGNSNSRLLVQPMPLPRLGYSSGNAQSGRGRAMSESDVRSQSSTPGTKVYAWRLANSGPNALRVEGPCIKPMWERESPRSSGMISGP